MLDERAGLFAFSAAIYLFASRAYARMEYSFISLRRRCVINHQGKRLGGRHASEKTSCRERCDRCLVTDETFLP
jgi:hypothetical protein